MFGSGISAQCQIYNPAFILRALLFLPTGSLVSPQSRRSAKSGGCTLLFNQNKRAGTNRRHGFFTVFARELTPPTIRPDVTHPSAVLRKTPGFRFHRGFRSGNSSTDAAPVSHIHLFFQSMAFRRTDHFGTEPIIR